MQPKDLRLATERDLENSIGAATAPLDQRLEDLEVSAGFTPGDINDTTAASLIRNPESETATELSAAISDSISSGLGVHAILRARLATRDSAPVLIVGVGDSFVSAENVPTASKWINQLAAKHSNYPVVFTWESFAAIESFPSGVQFINAGRSGRESHTYITVPEATTLGSKNPTLVIHMVGANDWAKALTYGTPTWLGDNLAARIDAIDAAATLPVAHILAHGHERFDPNISQQRDLYPWSDYLAARRKVASTRVNVEVMDFARMFSALGVPGSDPLDLMETDLLHADVPGMGIYVSEFGQALELPAPESLTPVLVDEFDDADGTLLNSRNADTGQAWVTDPGTFTINGGGVQSLTTGAIALAQTVTGHVDQDATAIIEFSGASLGGLMVRASDKNNGYLALIAAGGVDLYSVIGGTTTKIASGPKALTAGTYTLRVVIRGTSLSAYLDGVSIVSVSVPSADPAWTKAGMWSTGNAAKYMRLSVA